MKSRFPSDLLVVVFGPLLVMAIALGFGSFIYRAEQLSQGARIAVAAAVVILLLLVAFLVSRRRHRVLASGRNARDESTRNI